jgi:hypothetical protein
MDLRSWGAGGSKHLKPELAEVKTGVEKIWRHVGTAIRLYYPL